MSIQNAIQSANQLPLSCFEKAYFSYDHEKGWEVRILNCFQRALRWFFGMYRETHLVTIQSQYRHLDWNQMVDLSVINTNHRVLKIYLHSLYKTDGENTNQIAIASQNNQFAIERFNIAMNRLKRLADLLKDLPSTILLPKVRLLGSQACSFYAERCSSIHFHNTAEEYTERALAYLVRA